MIKQKLNLMLLAEKNQSKYYKHLKNSASEWVNDKDPDDDVTFVVIKVK